MKLKSPIEIIPHISIENNKCDIYAVFKENWGTLHYYIECKDYKEGVGIDIVDKFIYTFESVRKTDLKITQGMLISRNHFSPEARAHGEKAALILKTAALPPSIGQLSALRFLFLDVNQLTTLPETLLDISHLTHINVIGNPLTPLALELLKKLEKKGIKVDYREKTI